MSPRRGDPLEHALLIVAHVLVFAAIAFAWCVRDEAVADWKARAVAGSAWEGIR